MHISKTHLHPSSHPNRREFGTDEILEQPHPYFALIKECYPSYYCSEGRDGSPVYYERSGQVDQPRMRAAGCGIDQLVHHYIHMVRGFDCFLHCNRYRSMDGLAFSFSTL